jgi:hypothetical protein
MAKVVTVPYLVLPRIFSPKTKALKASTPEAGAPATGYTSVREAGAAPVPECFPLASTRKPLQKRKPGATPRNETPRNETPRNETPRNETPRNETPRNETPRNETPPREAVVEAVVEAIVEAVVKAAAAGGCSRDDTVLQPLPPQSQVPIKSPPKRSDPPSTRGTSKEKPVFKQKPKPKRQKVRQNDENAMTATHPPSNAQSEEIMYF